MWWKGLRLPPQLFSRATLALASPLGEGSLWSWSCWRPTASRAAAATTTTFTSRAGSLGAGDRHCPVTAPSQPELERLGPTFCGTKPPMAARRRPAGRARLLTPSPKGSVFCSCRISGAFAFYRSCLSLRLGIIYSSPSTESRGFRGLRFLSHRYPGARGNHFRFVLSPPRARRQKRFRVAAEALSAVLAVVRQGCGLSGTGAGGREAAVAAAAGDPAGEQEPEPGGGRLGLRARGSGMSRT